MCNTLEDELSKFRGSEHGQKVIIIEYDGDESSEIELTKEQRKEKGFLPCMLGIFIQHRD